jgi:hypothetical protein
MKILVAGDTHGNTRWTNTLVGHAVDQQAEIMVVVGDFGLWDHGFEGMEFLDSVNVTLRNHNRMLIWTDGNHENHDRLEWYRLRNPRSTKGLVYIRSNILYSPRGNAWTWDKKRFMTVGGAVSIDKDWRLQAERTRYGARTLWWPGEQLTDPEADGIVKATESPTWKPVDYLFTHDCLTNAPFKYRLKEDPESQAHRQKMDRVVKAIRPRWMFHGHMHERYVYEFPTYEPHTKVRGLECDGMRDSWGILDTELDAFKFATNIAKDDTNG